MYTRRPADDGRIETVANVTADLMRQFVSAKTIIVAGVAMAAVVLAAVYLLSRAMAVPVSWLTRDPAAITSAHPCVGLLSNLGIMLFAAATGICLIGAALVHPRDTSLRSARFLLSSGLLCLILTLDDTLLLHEEILPVHLHIHQCIVYAGYGLLATTYALHFRREILGTRYILMLLTFCCFGLSITLDMLLPLTEPQTFAEDGIKFVGIVFWLAYVSSTVRQTVTARP